MVSGNIVGAKHHTKISDTKPDYRQTVPEYTGNRGGKEISKNRSAHDQIQCSANELIFLFRAPIQNFRQVAKMLSVPEHKRPMCCERHSANQHDPDRDAPHFAMEKISDPRLLVVCHLLCRT